MSVRSDISKIIEPIGKIAKSDIILLNGFALFVGISCGFIAIFFRILISFFRDLFMFGKIRLSIVAGSPLDSPLGAALILIPAIGGLLVGIIVAAFAKEAKGHGVPEVMTAVINRGGRIRPRVTLIKALASAMCIGSGGVVGREGPIVQIGAATGSSIGQFLKLGGRFTAILVGCGAAGGIAATFNTPIAGVIFAIEIILTEFKTRSFIPLVISSVMATIVSRIFLGSSPAFKVPPYSFQHPIELAFYFILGILAALVGILMIKMLYGFEDFFDKIRIPEWVKPAIGGLLLGLLFFKFRYVMGVGYETMDKVFNQHFPLVLMIVLIFAKILGISLTLGSGGSGGVFAPALFVGCMLGGSFGYIIHSFFPEITGTYGAYALVGMAALFAAVSRATLTAIIIIFEMTLNYHIILPLMFACVIADALSHMISPETIYTKKLLKKGIIASQDMSSDPLSSVYVKDVMTSRIITVSENHTASDMQMLIYQTRHHGFPVIDSEGVIKGIVTEEDILRAKKSRKMKRPVKELISGKFIKAYPDETLDKVLSKMLSEKVTHIPIVERKNQKNLVGLLTRTDILNLLQFH
jgi:CIC family chloride channel protein